MENELDMTAEDLERLKNMRDEDIVFDEDCPPLTEEELNLMDYLMKKYHTRILTKEIYEREGLIPKKTA